MIISRRVVFLGGILNVPVLGCQTCTLRNFEAACWSISSEIWDYLMNLKLSIQKQKHSNSLITVRDLGLTISIKNSSSLVEKKHDDMFDMWQSWYCWSLTFIKDMPLFHLGDVNQHHHDSGYLACQCVHMYFRLMFDDMSFKGLKKSKPWSNKIKTLLKHIVYGVLEYLH